MKDQTAAPAKRKPYDSENVPEPLLPPTSRRGRPRRTDLREDVSAIIRALRSGCARRMLPRDPTPRQTVYAYFRTWKSDGTLKRVHDLDGAKLALENIRALRIPYPALPPLPAD